MKSSWRIDATKGLLARPAAWLVLAGGFLIADYLTGEAIGGDLSLPPFQHATLPRALSRVRPEILPGNIPARKQPLGRKSHTAAEAAIKVEGAAPSAPHNPWR
jgi:hypothetical protein